MKPLIAVIVAVCSYLVTGEEYVDMVRQNFANDINTALVQQIQKELTASYIYQAYASYFQRSDVSLPGIRKFFSEASLEERDHAQALIDYINERGGHAQFDEIDLKKACEGVMQHSKSDSSGLADFDDRRMCICGFVATRTINNRCASRDNWQEGLMAFEDALAIERYVNEQLLTIHQHADGKNDAHLTHILEHKFLEEQVSSINTLAHYVTRLRSFAQGNNYKLGEYMFDQKLA